MIDKVVRMRSQYGRFGIDHSELLNYELEQTNKPRDDHMNWLVYKRGMFQGSDTKESSNDFGIDDSLGVSQILFKRLAAKDEEKYSNYSQRTPRPVSMSGSQGSLSTLRKNGGNGLPY